MKFKVKLIKTSIISGTIELETDSRRYGMPILKELVEKDNLAKCIKDSPIHILLNQGTLIEEDTTFKPISICS